MVYRLSSIVFIFGTGTTGGSPPIPDEKRTLIDTDASHHRLTLMIFQIFHPCESVFPPSCHFGKLSAGFVPLCFRGFLPRYVTTGYFIFGTGTNCCLWRFFPDQRQGYGPGDAPDLVEARAWTDDIQGEGGAGHGLRIGF